MEKRTFTEWENGLFSVVDGNSLRQPKILGFESNTPIQVSWENILEEDIIRIKLRQKEIHETIVKFGFESLKSSFELRVSLNSRKDELVKFESAIYKEIIDKDFINEPQYKVYDLGVFKLDTSKLSRIKPIFSRLQRKLTPYSGYIITSTSTWTKKWERFDHSIAEVIFRYYNWLEDKKSFDIIPEAGIQKIETIAKNTENVIKLLNSDIIRHSKSDEIDAVFPEDNVPQYSTNETKPIDFDTDIFRDDMIGYKIFKEFQANEIGDKTQYADYSFIFKKLLSDNLIREVKHVKYLDFLYKNYQLEFANQYTQLKSKFKDKSKAYARVKDLFKS